jgi:hypothetical protein
MPVNEPVDGSARESEGFCGTSFMRPAGIIF